MAKLKTNYVDETGLWSWWIIAGVVGVLAAYNLCQLVRDKRCRRVQIPDVPSLTGPAESEKGLHSDDLPEKRQAKSSGLLGAVRKIPNALATMLNVTTLRLPFYPSATVVEILFIIAYIAILYPLILYRTYGNGIINYSNPMGYMAYVQMPFIIGLASKNNVISYLTGISYQKLNFFHRATGRVALICSWTHALGRIDKGLKRDMAFGMPALSWGIVALASMTFLFLTSFRPVRRLCYEFFWLSHVICVLMLLIGSYFHWEKLNYWIWPGFVIWGLDRFVSFGRMVFSNTWWRSRRDDAVVEWVGDDVLRVSITRPAFKWTPGQHAFLTMPSVSTTPIEQHPFTMANVPSPDGQVVFLIRVHRGFTAKLAKAVAAGKSQIPLRLDGPYGCPPLLAHFDTVLLICGGTGITYGLSTLLGVITTAKQGKSMVRRLHLVWHVRNANDYAWISDMVAPALRDLPHDLEVIIEFRVTRGTVSADPDEEGAIALKSLPLDSPASNGSVTSSDDKSSISSRNVAGAMPKNVVFCSGRADIPATIETARTEAKGPMHVSVCGPQDLALGVRKAVSGLVLRESATTEKPSITFSSETFGW